jgi:hypothetical protein
VVNNAFATGRRLLLSSQVSCNARRCIMLTSRLLEVYYTVIIVRFGGHTVVYKVETLCYKSKGRGFEIR